MGVPDIIDLDSSSDTRFRDVYTRHQNLMMSRSGNLIRTIYHHVGAQTNVAAAEIVSVDANENAQYDVVMRNSTAPITLANLTNANISTWSASSILSLRQGTTAIRSANVTVANLTTTSLNVAPGVLNKLDNVVVQSFQKTLVSGAGAATEICTITQPHGIYTAELDVIQSVSIGSNISRSYKFVSWYNATSNAWRRLVPLASSGNNAQQWGVEIRVNNTDTTLRLVRLTGTVTGGFECVLKISQPRANPVTIANSTLTENAGNVTFSTTIHDNSVISQTLGRVGIGTDIPTQLLTVAGTANVQSLTVGGDATFNASTLRIDSGNNRVGIGTSNPSATLDVTGTLNVTSNSTQNVVRANAVSIQLTTGNNAVLIEGTHIGYNTQIGGGTSDFMNKCAAATGGFKFYRSTGSGTASEYSNNTLLASLATSGLVVTGDVSGSIGAFNRLSALQNILDSTPLFQGAHTTWNYSGSNGETNFVNKSGTGSGGFVFYNTTGNGSSFDTGRTAMLNMTSTAFSLASTMRQTYTPTVTASTNVNYTASSATGYYMDFGAIKIVWGTATFTWTAQNTTSGECNVTLPSSFLGTLTLANFSVHRISGTNNQYVFGGSTAHTTSRIYFFMNTNGAATTHGQTVGFFVIGH